MLAMEGESLPPQPGWKQCRLVEGETGLAIHPPSVHLVVVLCGQQFVFLCWQQRRELSGNLQVRLLQCTLLGAAFEGGSEAEACAKCSGQIDNRDQRVQTYKTDSGSLALAAYTLPSPIQGAGFNL